MKVELNCARPSTHAVTYAAGLGNPRPEEDLPQECKIYVGSVPPNVDEHALTREFSRFGPVVR